MPGTISKHFQSSNQMVTRGPFVRLTPRSGSPEILTREAYRIRLDKKGLFSYKGSVTFLKPVPAGDKIEAKGDICLAYGAGDNVFLKAKRGVEISGDIGHDVAIEAGGRVKLYDAGDNLHIQANHVQGTKIGRNCLVQAWNSMVLGETGPGCRLSSISIVIDTVGVGSLVVRQPEPPIFYGDVRTSVETKIGPENRFQFRR